MRNWRRWWAAERKTLVPYSCTAYWEVVLGHAFKGPLTDWGVEADALSEYLGRPVDVLSARVVRFAELTEPITLGNFAPSARSQFDEPFRPDFDYAKLADYYVKDGRSADAVLDDWGCIEGEQLVSASVVRPVMRLLFHGEWGTLLFRRCWKFAREAFPRDVWENLSTDEQSARTSVAAWRDKFTALPTQTSAASRPRLLES